MDGGFSSEGILYTIRVIISMGMSTMRTQIHEILEMYVCGSNYCMSWQEEERFSTFKENLVY